MDVGRPARFGVYLRALAFALAITGGATSRAADFSDWHARVPITFTGLASSGGETLTNFPALVILGTNLPGFAYSTFHSTAGDDLRFAAADETTELQYEIDTWNTNGDSLVWVQVPELRGTNTTIWAYWGRSGVTAPAYTTNGATWEAGYCGVWHLNDTSVRDSTSNALHGTSFNTINAAGTLGGAQRFDGTTAHIAIPTVSIPSNITVALWAHDSNFDENQALAAKETGNENWVFFTEAEAGGHTLRWRGGSLTALDTPLPVADAWHHLAAAQADTNAAIFVDGAAMADGAVSALGDSTNVLTLGRYHEAGVYTGYYLSALLDEVRISGVRRSDAWLRAEYLSVASNALFCSFGELTSKQPPVVANRKASAVTTTSATLNAELLSTGGTETGAAVYWGAADGGGDLAAWAHTNVLSGAQAAGALALGVTFSPSNTMYCYRFRATNELGAALAEPSSTFLPGAVSVVATAAGTSEKRGSSPGVFTISRPASATNAELVVAYALGGTAANGADYAALSSNVTLAVGAASATVMIAPFFDMVNEGAEEATLTLAPGPYLLGAASSASVSIQDALAFSQTHVNTWTGNGHWSSAGNWSLGRTPIEGDDVRIDGSVELSTSTPVLLAATLESGSIVFNGWNTALIASNVVISTGMVTHLPQAAAAAPWVADHRVNIECAHLTVASGASIHGDGMGYDGDRGPGAGPIRADGQAAAGAGHGGLGGPGIGMAPAPGGATYGVAEAPEEPGSGGGLAGSAGGGAVRIAAAGMVRIDGVVDADGENEPAFAVGSGSGGSIWITCDTVAGNGSLSAIGGVNTEGNRYGGSGGGGRMAVHFRNDWFAGSRSVAPGDGAEIGTLVWRQAGTDPILSVWATPANYGMPTPYFYGANAVRAGSAVVNATGSPVAVGAGHRAAVVGWAATTNGSAYASGAGTVATFTMPDAPVALTYFWTNIWELTAVSGPNGSVAAGVNGWYTNGTIVAVHAAADPGFAFAQWTGDVPAGSNRMDVLQVPMDRVRALTAHFASTTPGIKTAIASGAWADDSLWSPPGMPGPQDSVVNDSHAVVVGDAVWVSDVLNSGTLTFAGWDSVLNGDDVYNLGTIDHLACSGTGAATNRVTLRCRNLIVPDGGAVTADARGYVAQQGPGAGFTDGFGVGGGGGYGGAGGQGFVSHIGNWGGNSYGVSNAPTGPGSGGGHVSGGSGGGSIWVEASASVTIDGTLTAHGADTSFAEGGGSGGAIYLDCESLKGHGVIAANGGRDLDGNHYGGTGGGGRIALLYANNLFGGAVSVDPGFWQNGWNCAPGETGTIYRLNTSGHPTLTVRGSPSAAGAVSPYAYGEHAVPAEGWVVNDAGSPADESGGQRKECTGWLVTTGGVAVAGGTGGHAEFAMPAIDAVLTYWWTNAFLLTADAAANGRVNTNASAWYIDGASVPLTAEADPGYAFLQWTGDLAGLNPTANPLAVPMDRPRHLTAQFQVPVSERRAWNGTGIWSSSTNWTPAGVPGAADEAVIESGSVALAYAVTLGNLTVETGAVLTVSGWDSAIRADTVTNRGAITHEGCSPAQPSNRVFIVCRDFTLVSNATVDVAGRGYAAGQGPGAGGTDGSFNTGGGGGFGGAGGHGFAPHAGATGGPAYGEARAPLGPGSGGGTALGGAGGGAIRVEATGTVCIDGVLNADGAQSGAYNGGGGSGGAIWITCFRFAGAGELRAVGGNQAVSENLYGGGGGGGRIAIGRAIDEAVALRVSVRGGTNSASEGLAGTDVRYGAPLSALMLTIR